MTPEVPDGWVRVMSGEVAAGDRLWHPEEQEWIEGTDDVIDALRFLKCTAIEFLHGVIRMLPPEARNDA